MRKKIWIPEAPHINFRRYKEVGGVTCDIGVKGRFTVELVHARTGFVKRRLEFDNLITDVGIDYLFTASTNGMYNATNYVAVGTGSTTPTTSDTSLESEIARTSNAGGFSDSWFSDGLSEDREYNYRRRTRVFTEEEANGNLTELGCFTSSSGGTMWNRQLFRDELGNPTTITKTSDDQLRIVYDAYVYIPVTDGVQEITVAGTPTQFTTRALAVVSSNSWGLNGALRHMANLDAGAACLRASDRTTFYARNYTNTPTGDNDSSHSIQSYTSGSFYRDREVTFNAGTANYEDGVSFLASFLWSYPNANFQVLIDPPIPKTDTEKLVITDRFSISRHEEP